VADLASRISGSSDIFNYRGPTSSINFVTAHDGFTLNDLVSYSGKNNFANQEDNRDGSNENRSWNSGVEGVTDDPHVLAIRQSLKKSILATLLLSSGVPMITMGDEVSRSQNGSNNAYSMPQDMHPGITDSEETFGGGWAMDWELDAAQKDIRDAVEMLASIRNTYLINVASDFFTGALDQGTQRKDIAWFSASGFEMTAARWADGDRRSLTVFIDAGSDRGLLLLLNSSTQQTSFTFPDDTWGDSFRSIFDASHVTSEHESALALPSSTVDVAAHSAQVWLVTRTTR
jgi:glycogen operon protein